MFMCSPSMNLLSRDDPATADLAGSLLTWIGGVEQG